MIVRDDLPETPDWVCDSREPKPVEDLTIPANIELGVE